MKKSIVLAVGMAVLIGSTTALAGTRDPGVNKRQHQQKQRIKQGVVSGSLTAREAVRLQREQQKINRQERRFKSDGTLTRDERVTLHRSQNRASRHIYQQKHDDQSR